MTTKMKTRLFALALMMVAITAYAGTYISGFKIYYGSAPATYTNSVTLGNITVYAFTSLPTGTYYFSATCLDDGGSESDHSNEVSKYVVSGQTVTLAWDRPSTFSDGTTLLQGSTITASAGANGMIAPSGGVLLSSETYTQFTVTPSGNYSIQSVGGTCGGTLVGSLYTTATITQNCTVTATFTPSKYTVTSSSGSNGTISPLGSGLVTVGTTTSFTVSPNPGYTASIGGTCGGSLSGTTYTTNAIYGNCAVTATFALITYTITSSAGANGTIAPAGQVIVNYGSTKAYTVTPSSGYTASIGGTCGGTLVGTTYTTGSVVQNCSVVASFSIIPINGACGSSHGGTFDTAPDADLCATGNPSTPTGTGPWNWQCIGLYGGTTASNCAASIAQYTVTGIAGSGGSISPASALVSSGSTTAFTLNPDYGYNIDLATGCSGTLVGPIYTTGSIVSACTVTASFASSSPDPPSILTGRAVGIRAIGVIPR